MIDIPYDLFAGLLMLLIFIILLVFLIVGMRQRRFSKRKLITTAILTVILIGIPVVGHSEWNRNAQLKNELDTFQADDYLPNTIAPELLQALQDASRPLQVKIVSSTEDLENEPNQIYFTVINLEGDLFKVRLASYTYPLPWSPFETWVIESIQKQ
ncbi:hypothetical protein CIG75_17000 [Tumebacillus algifaecis]|uniref:Uncharacterized protein n=1 Tax=Tumebacillus algifaecis TaxID=1214604 RepID=A0A223D4G2_9BACL|nr:hypothetical protein [Tumebacillus algifaecis]ASS76488.1 hypothetical protein CIG75_17000 [Tumebacillus algifaecis]